MSTKFDIVNIRLNELHTQQVQVGKWETPVLQAVHGDAEVVGSVEVDREPPDAVEEYNRLANRYGDEAKSEIPYVGLVYGQFGPGIQALSKAIGKRKAEAA